MTILKIDNRYIVLENVKHVQYDAEHNSASVWYVDGEFSDHKGASARKLVNWLDEQAVTPGDDR